MAENFPEPGPWPQRRLDLLPWLDTHIGCSDITDRRLAEIFVDRHATVPLSVALPYAFATPPNADSPRPDPAAVGSSTSAGWPRARELGGSTVRHLTDNPHLDRAAVIDLVESLIRRGADYRDGLAVREFDELVTTLSEKDRFLLRARIIPATRIPVAKCAAALSISSESVAHATGRLRVRLRRSCMHARYLSSAVADLRRVARPVAALDRTLSVVPELSRESATLRFPLWSASVVLDPLVVVTDGWVLTTSVESARAHARTALVSAAGQDGIAELSAAAGLLRMPVAEASSWLSHCGFQIRGDYVMIRAAVSDHVAALLSTSGQPMTLREIHAAVEPARSLSTIRNALNSDHRFRRSDRTRWALARWDVSTYQPIHRRIGTLLDEHGGTMDLGLLIDRITEGDDVKADSVRTYAKTGEFTTAAGVVRRRRRTFEPGKSPVRTRHLYREGSTLRLRITLKPLHVKGTAFHCPSALAGMLGVRSGRNIELISRLGPQPLSWAGFQAKFGSMRRFVEDGEFALGDEFFVVVDPDASGAYRFDVIAAARFHPSGDRVRDVLHATGHSRISAAPEPDLIPALAHALWLSTEVGLDDIVQTLRRRQEFELADYLEHA